MSTESSVRRAATDPNAKRPLPPAPLRVLLSMSLLFLPPVPIIAPAWDYSLVCRGKLRLTESGTIKQVVNIKNKALGHVSG